MYKTEQSWHEDGGGSTKDSKVNSNKSEQKFKCVTFAFAFLFGFSPAWNVPRLSKLNDKFH